LNLVTCSWGKEVVDSILKVSSRDYIVSISTRRLIQDERGSKQIWNIGLQNNKNNVPLSQQWNQYPVKTQGAQLTEEKGMVMLDKVIVTHRWK
jgi:hypothetical protein